MEIPYLSSIINRFRPVYERNKSGDHTYTSDLGGLFGFSGENIELAQEHPILSAGLLFVSKLYSQGKRRVIDIRTNEEVEGHWLNTLFDNPNPYQTAMDFDEQQMFVQIAQGKTVCWARPSNRFEKKPKYLYYLDSSKITYPDGFKTSMISSSSYDKTMNQTVFYAKGTEEEEEIPLSQLLFFYDMPNGIHENRLESKSRIDGIKQVLINSIDSQIAKNIILKSNGKEMITSKEDGFPLGVDEKKEAENTFNTGMGLSFGRKRGLVTKASLSWQSMHIALRDLGLDESTKVDGNIIYTALHIPKDIMSLEAKKTTYNNYKESMVSYIQNEIIPSAVAADQVFQRLIKDEPYMKVETTYEHLPVMQFILKERYEVVRIQTEALTSMINAGFPEEYALDICGFKKDTVLKPIKTQDNETNGEQDD